MSITEQPATNTHLQDELLRNSTRITVRTRYGPVIGGRASNNAAAWLEIPYALPPKRFEDPQPLPASHQYEYKEYIKETTYACQPAKDGQAAGVPVEDKLGFGKPSEDPLFLNIVAPPSLPAKTNFPVKIYIHGGFLQFGSPHGLGSQAQYVSAARQEVWVNVGYRLSAFGFLSSDIPNVSGNLGFKDQWLACQWIKQNIDAFGGNPDDITITGLSAGAHSVHQLLHHVSRLPEGEVSPFHTAQLQSNAIVANPKTPSSLRAQYEALCRGLSLDPSSPSTLDALREPSIIHPSQITELIDSEKLGMFGTFRGSLEPGWYQTDPNDTLDLMAWQRTGGFARGLREKGVKRIVVGEVKEEWYLYSIAHDRVSSEEDIRFNLERYYEREVVERMMGCYDALPPDASQEDIQKLLGEILSDGQVYLPVRMLARDLIDHGFPVLRYQIRWAPEQLRKTEHRYVTHGTDRALWAYRLPSLESDQAQVATTWLDAIDTEVHSTAQRRVDEVLTIKEDRSIGWTRDERWETDLKVIQKLEKKEW